MLEIDFETHKHQPALNPYSDPTAALRLLEQDLLLSLISLLNNNVSDKADNHL